MGISDFFEQVRSQAGNFTLLEIAGTVTALAYVVLAARRNIFCWWFGLASAVIYTYISFSVKYYQDAIIQAYYIVMSFVGWWMWKNNRQSEEEVQPRFASTKFLLTWLLIASVVTPVSGFLFDCFFDNALPYLDAFTTVFAFLATWMGARRHPEHWLIFVAVDAVGIYMYFMKGLYITSFLFSLYTIIAAYSYFLWVRKIRHISAKS